MRPALKPALARLWRDGTTLQLGISPDRAFVLSGLRSADRAVLDALDGSRSRSQMIVAAPDPGGTASLLSRLEQAGALDDASASGTDLPGDRRQQAPDLASLSLMHPAPGDGLAVLRARAASRVDVRGCGRIGSQLAALLAAAGVGAVRTDDPLPAAPADVAPGGLRREDVGRSRGAGAAAAVARAVGGRPAGHGRGAPHAPDLVVLAADRLDRVTPDAGDDAMRASTPLLVAGIRETTGVVGPLVLPGSTGCLRCQHLHRCDRDPAWPAVAAQLAGRATPLPPCDVALSALVAALAALQALDLLAAAAAPSGASDRLPAAVGGSLEVSLPAWHVRRRSWPVHPLCTCTAPKPAATPAGLRVARIPDVGEGG